MLLDEDVKWMIKVIRMNSFIKSEEIEIMVDKSGLKSYLDDRYIRKQGVLRMDSQGKINKTSHFNLMLGADMKQIDLYVRNVVTTMDKTFIV